MRSALPASLRILGMLLSPLALLMPSPASAQTGCRTPNCALSTAPPAGCVNRASPYTTAVQMMNTLVFSPQNPKIEPGDCVAWTSQTGVVTHSSSADNCADTDTVCSVQDPDGMCNWDSGNETAAAVDVCFYDPLIFPGATSDGFYCRFHCNPSHTLCNMFGTMQVTTPIGLTVGKDLTNGNILLSWTGGGVTGDVTYRVVRSLVGDPRFTVGVNTVTGSPDGGNAGTMFTELGGLSDPASHYYLIRNRQTTEP